MGRVGPACRRFVRYYRNRVFRAFFHALAGKSARARSDNAACRGPLKISVQPPTCRHPPRRRLGSVCMSERCRCVLQQRSSAGRGRGRGRLDRTCRSHHCCIFTCVNDALAHERLSGILELIDRWGDLYLRRWGKQGNPESPGLAAEVDKGIDEVRARTKLAHDVIAAMGEEELAAKVVEHEEGLYGSHPFTQARVAIVEAIAILAQREELARSRDLPGRGSWPLKCIRSSGALPPSSGTTAMSDLPFRLPRLRSKGFCRALPAPAIR